MGQGRIHEGQILHRDTQTDKEAFQGLFTFLAHVRSVLVFPEGDTGIMAAKAEIIGKDNVHICLGGQHWGRSQDPFHLLYPDLRN